MEQFLKPMTYYSIMNLYESSVQSEMTRLANLGWKDWTTDEFDVKSRSLVERTISFPEDWWNAEQINSESDGIWAQTRARNIMEVLNEKGIKLMWEIGAGNGNVAIPLKNFGFTVIGVEPLSSGARSLAKSGLVAYQGTLSDLALPSSSIEAIGIFDVIEHLENPGDVLTEIRRVLKPGGVLILTVPANQWLFSDFDVSIGHYRRYSRKSLRKLLAHHGFDSSQDKYLFFSFVLPAFLTRALPYRLGRKRDYRKTFKSVSIETKLLSILSPIVSIILRIEKMVPLPTGLSLLSHAIKDQES